MGIFFQRPLFQLLQRLMLISAGAPKREVCKQVNKKHRETSFLTSSILPSHLPSMVTCVRVILPKTHTNKRNICAKKKKTMQTSIVFFFLPTCPEEAKRLMVVRSIQPRLVSSLWFTSRNWTIARLAASGKTQTHRHMNKQFTEWKVTAHCITQMSCWNNDQLCKKESSWWKRRESYLQSTSVVKISCLDNYRVSEEPQSRTH